MDAAPPQTAPSGAPQNVDQLPPEALALATRFFDAARNGQMDIFEQGLSHGLPSNMTNDRGDSLVMLASYHGHTPLVKAPTQSRRGSQPIERPGTESTCRCGL